MELSADPRTQPAACPRHGAFESRLIVGRVWSKCPTCADEAAAEAAEQDRRDRAAAAEARHQRMLADARIPAHFRGKTFDSFVAETDAQRHVVTTARDFAERFEDHLAKGLGLVMSGRPGNGKTHLAAAILQAVLTPEVRYTTALDLVRAVRDTWRRDSDRSELQLLGYLERLDLLVIDEIGMQYGTDGEQTILFDVLDRRCREVRPTILLTNQDKAGFKQFVGERTFDRLTETCRWVAFDWDSYRPTARRSA